VDDGALRRPLGAQQRDEIVEGVALMEEHRQRSLAGIAQLRGEDLALLRPRAVIVVVIQADLANRDRPQRSRLRDERVERRGDARRRVLGLVRMDAHRPLRAVCRRARLRPAARVEVRPDEHDPVDARRPRPLERRRAVAVEIGVVNVRVRVDHRGR